MKIEFSLNEDDFLMHQLYVASKSNTIRKRRTRNRIIIPLLYFVFAFLIFIQNKIIVATIICIIGIVWFLFYPKWDKRHYINHYKKFIKENYKARFEEKLSLEFYNDFILAYDAGSESKILTKEIEEIVEICTNIFIRLKGGQSIILPKNKINDINKLTKVLRELAAYLNIKYTLEDNWIWK